MVFADPGLTVTRILFDHDEEGDGDWMLEYVKRDSEVETLEKGWQMVIVPENNGAEL